MEEDKCIKPEVILASVAREEELRELTLLDRAIGRGMWSALEELRALSERMQIEIDRDPLCRKDEQSSSTPALSPEIDRWTGDFSGVCGLVAHNLTDSEMVAAYGRNLVEDYRCSPQQ